jgi:hypothetical protein
LKPLTGKLAQRRFNAFGVVHVCWRNVDSQRDAVFFNAEIDVDTVDLLATINAALEATRCRAAGAAVDDDSSSCSELRQAINSAGSAQST